jgi:hypothetical protein
MGQARSTSGSSKVSTIGRIRKLAKEMGVTKLQVLTDSGAIWRKYRVYGWLRAGRGCNWHNSTITVKKAHTVDERFVVATLLHELGHQDQYRTGYLHRDKVIKLYTTPAIRRGDHREERLRVERDAWRRGVIIGKRLGVTFDKEMRDFRAHCLSTYMEEGAW